MLTNSMLTHIIFLAILPNCLWAVALWLSSIPSHCTNCSYASLACLYFPWNNAKILSLWPWPSGHVWGWGWYCVKFWTSIYHHTKHEPSYQTWTIIGFGNNEVLKTLTQNFNIKAKSVTLTLKPCMGVGMTLCKILDQYLSSHQTWTKSIKGFGNNEVLKTLM